MLTSFNQLECYTLLKFVNDINCCSCLQSKRDLLSMDLPPSGNYSSTPEKCFNFQSNWTGSPTETITYK